jgi:RNA polymerase sigma-70 factor (ECF subfamily)
LTDFGPYFMERKLTPKTATSLRKLVMMSSFRIRVAEKEKNEFSGGVITRCLKEWRAGDEDALSRLATEVYGELRRLSGAIMGRYPDNQTIQPTALIHELYLKLPGVREIDWQSRAQFLNVAAAMMRNILVDHARSRRAVKRGGDGIAVTVADPPFHDRGMQIDVLLVHNALGKFASLYPRQARVVELRFFGGLTADEIVEVLRNDGTESSRRTVERDWSFARAWLQNAIRPE